MKREFIIVCAALVLPPVPSHIPSPSSHFKKKIIISSSQQPMAPSVRRRLTPVNYAKQLINAVLSIRQQKQIPNFERISRYLQRYTDITPRRCKEHLNNAVSDGLIVEYTAVGVKGQRTGLEQEGYRIPHPGEVPQEVSVLQIC